MTARILVAGIGNIFLGDDGFGSEVVRNAELPPDDPTVQVIDYGIRGMHLAYDLLEEWAALVLVDAVPSQGHPGTLHVFQADHDSSPENNGLDGHSMDPAAVFASLRALGGHPPYTVVVGCEAGSIEEGIGLTEPVAQAVPRAARAVEEIVAALHGATPAVTEKED
ncbi:peptidase M52 [Mycobacterium mantenii]|uniref:Peptidase M52 n=1 Tax=Mycobacterium mantenii TaxID=560555 RepID=A0A1X0FFX5_MYCNT|nr:hydrogenase maturation protease [Mycobacterium mantenii]MCV7241830.1 hydrogenase maturation protease [Mycobacterium mantenii]ORB00653.1 peptidase M52 [Mycobacterium mantenii]BBY36114.1 peptidase M52 [Mycobacterium mantenii]